MSTGDQMCYVMQLTGARSFIVLSSLCDTAAGLQDRVIQVFGGCVFMDFSPTIVKEHGHGLYEPLDPSLLPTLYVQWLFVKDASLTRCVRSYLVHRPAAIVEESGKVRSSKCVFAPFRSDKDVDKVSKCCCRCSCFALLHHRNTARCGSAG